MARTAGWLASRRCELGLTQRRFGKLVGVSQSRISSWEREKTKPTPPEWERIEEAFSNVEPASEPLPRRVPAKDVLATQEAALGTVPDAEISRRTGISVRTILHYRRTRGIPAYDRHRGGRGPTPTSASTV